MAQDTLSRLINEDKKTLEARKTDMTDKDTSSTKDTKSTKDRKDRPQKTESGRMGADRGRQDDNLETLLSRINKKIQQLERQGFKSKIKPPHAIEWVYLDRQSRSNITLSINDYDEDFGFRIEVVYKVRDEQKNGKGQFRFIDERDDVPNSRAADVADEFIRQAEFYVKEVFPVLEKAVKM